MLARLRIFSKPLALLLALAAVALFLGVRAYSHSGERQRFLQDFGGAYIGHIDSLREKEFSRLAKTGSVYLDYAGAGLYAESDVRAAADDLATHVYGNPHSQSASGVCSEDRLEEMRIATTEFFHTSLRDYTPVFTSGATGAIKAVAESFPWGPGSKFIYTLENHNSVVGVREVAAERGASFEAVPYRELLEELGLGGPGAGADEEGAPAGAARAAGAGAEEEGPFHLLALPAECNLSGSKFDLRIIRRARAGRLAHRAKGRWLVLLDAAKAAASGPLDLTRYPADFVALSFYKLFGYPTGVGALLVRYNAAPLLRRTYFGGGTVAGSLAEERFHVLREGTAARFEDGTTNFLGVAASRFGFARMRALGMPAIQRHTGALALWTMGRLSALRHSNGAPFARLYTDWPPAGHAAGQGGDPFAARHLPDFVALHGPVVTFNVLRRDGRFVGHATVEAAARDANISLRSGCFCNPGACKRLVNVSSEEVKERARQGETCSTEKAPAVERPTGAVRVSFGYMNSVEDAQALLDFLTRRFLDRD